MPWDHDGRGGARPVAAEPTLALGGGDIGGDGGGGGEGTTCGAPARAGGAATARAARLARGERRRSRPPLTAPHAHRSSTPRVHRAHTPRTPRAHRAHTARAAPHATRAYACADAPPAGVHAPASAHRARVRRGGDARGEWQRVAASAPPNAAVAATALLRQSTSAYPRAEPAGRGAAARRVR